MLFRSEVIGRKSGVMIKNDLNYYHSILHDPFLRPILLNPRTPMSSMKLQTTLTGSTAWFVAKLAELKGKTQAEIASYLLERWIDDNHEYLAKHGINYETFDTENRGGTVEQFERSKDG